MPAKPALLCKNCPWRKTSPKAGEPGGSVPAHDLDRMQLEAKACGPDGFKVMQCHDSTSEDPRGCAGFLSVVGYDSPGVRLGVCLGVIRDEDVGRPIHGLYSSLHEMLREADHIDLDQ